MNLPGIRCGDVRQIEWFFHIGIDYLTLHAKSCLCEAPLTAYLVLWHTVLLKCKSWIETWFSILEVFENQVSRLEFQVLIFEVREPSFEDWVLSFKTLKEFFEDLEQRFWGNNLMLENKTIAMNKTIEARLYSCKPAVECRQIFFCVVHFLKDTCGSLIYTEADDRKLA